ncbi:hypothetical protein [Niabella beijingensis]|uniref:hypothetical protein n=1 Tax=Niabella beijingensis TaxID=2872700 RepID=UPI001CBE87EC|nr:hypothetical protein [Niabella beijingensis]MBZ4188273.1 hypothetical protein [Niabella beijingensis]
MPSRSTDALFQLIKSLEKSEKRNLKLFAGRNSGAESLKSMQLFNALDKLPEYDEKVLLKRVPAVSKQQLSNTKALLYKQILSSLRIIREDKNVDMQLREIMDSARILFNKGLYLQTLKALDRAKEVARTYHQMTYLQQALFFEKKIEGLYITRSIQNRADELAEEADAVIEKIAHINTLSNLALQLYSWYIQNGHARNENDVKTVKLFFEKSLPRNAVQLEGFYEKQYYYQSYAWYAFIKLDFLAFYRYCQKWVDSFEAEPQMIQVETTMYIKGVHNLMSAHFDLMNRDGLAACIKKFKHFVQTPLVQDNNNNRINGYVYLYTAVINLHFLEGTFHRGLKMVPYLEEMLIEHGRYLDRHRVMVFYYKIACLYFGSGNNKKAIDYLNRIIHQKDDLRTDLQCYSRLLHLIAHYELGNFDLLEYLIKSVYRYMAKMENLSKVEEEMFRFLRNAFKFNTRTIKPEFEKLLVKLKRYQNNRLEARAFAYLDVISWLESKLSGINVQDVIRKKYLRESRLSKKNAP